MSSIPQNPKATAAGETREGRGGAARPRRLSWPGRRPALAEAVCFAIPFALVLGISLEGGGFDPIVFGQLGVVAWWAAMLCAIAGVASLGGLPRGAWLALGALTAFVAWTGLSMLWSESAGRSGLELARACSYLAVLALTLALAGRDRRGPMLAGVAAAIGAVALIALLARMQPDVLPRNDTIDLVAAAQTRLNYPLGYWNGLAGLLAIGMPLLAHFAVRPARGVGRVAASAALPAVALAIYLTLSRGGALAAAVALGLLLWLHPSRARLAAQLAAAAAGAGLLIAAAEASPEFMAGARAGAGLSQGDVLLGCLILVCGLSAAWPLAADRLGARRDLRGVLGAAAARVRRVRPATVGALLAAVVALALVLGAPERIGDRWQQFKDPEVAGEADRLASASGNGRYQWWQAAFDAGTEHPVLGLGAGTFGFWWLREASFPSQVTDAHSLYLESFAELGLIGLGLIVVAVCGSLVLIVVRCRRSRGDPKRGQLAAAAAAIAAFAVAAGIDWAWELPALPIAAVLVIGAALAPDTPAALRPSRIGHRRGRVALAALAVAGILAIAPALLGLDRIRASQEHFRAGDLEAALDAAEQARALEPYSGSAAVQEAIVLQTIGDLRGAVASAREATEKEPTNWANWLVLARFERILDEHRGASEAARIEAERLNPHSALFR